MGGLVLDAVIRRMIELKQLGDQVLERVSAEQLLHRSDEEANSIAVIVQHLHGNMLSRWTDFLTTDGEKPWRERDAEFEPRVATPEEARALWEEGWALTLGTLKQLSEQDLHRQVRIRGEGMSVADALVRQVAHYGYHVGQMVTLARQQHGTKWASLSIPRGRSREYKP
jgi:uncharacterized damage-inducible protein DinB